MRLVQVMSEPTTQPTPAITYLDQFAYHLANTLKQGYRITVAEAFKSMRSKVETPRLSTPDLGMQHLCSFRFDTFGMLDIYSDHYRLVVKDNGQYPSGNLHAKSVCIIMRASMTHRPKEAQLVPKALSALTHLPDVDKLTRINKGLGDMTVGKSVTYVNKDFAIEYELSEDGVFVDTCHTTTMQKISSLMGSLLTASLDACQD